MKKGLLLVLLIISASFMFATNFVSATDNSCKLGISLLNQDPYPAVPGDYVKLVFQVSGIDNPSCSDITFRLLPDYPITFDPGKSGVRQFSKVDYVKDYESSLLVPYKVRISNDALDGATPVEIRVQSKNSAPILKSFNLKVSDVRAHFEVYVSNYDYKTHKMTLEILNTASSNIEALTVEIPKQKNIQIKGANKNIVGDLDSDEYTTADFEAVPLNGNFSINLVYSDAINVRRTVTKTINFDSSYFVNRKADERTTSVWMYLLYIIIALALIYWLIKGRKKKK